MNTDTEKEYKYELKLTVDGTDIDLDAIRQLFSLAFKGDCLNVSGTPSQAVISYHSDTPWSVMEYCATFGEIHDISVKNLNVEKG